MSILNWFTRKSAPVPARNMEPSGLLNPEATIPLVPGLYGRQMPEPAAPEHAANRKNERMERRELLYTVVRDAMVRAGVLSASYKFKVLSLDQRGSQFLVMMDLAREFGGDTARLSEIEALIAQTAKSRYDIAVTAVYWRSNEHVAVGNPKKPPLRRVRPRLREIPDRGPSQQHPPRCRARPCGPCRQLLIPLRRTRLPPSRRRSVHRPPAIPPVRRGFLCARVPCVARVPTISPTPKCHRLGRVAPT